MQGIKYLKKASKYVSIAENYTDENLDCIQGLIDNAIDIIQENLPPSDGLVKEMYEDGEDLYFPDYYKSIIEGDYEDKDRLVKKLIKICKKIKYTIDLPYILRYVKEEHRQLIFDNLEIDLLGFNDYNQLDNIDFNKYANLGTYVLWDHECVEFAIDHSVDSKYCVLCVNKEDILKKTPEDKRNQIKDYVKDMKVIDLYI